MTSLFLPLALLLSSAVLALSFLSFKALRQEEKENNHKKPDLTDSKLLIWQAQKKAQELIAEAELTAVKRIAQKDFETTKQDDNFREHLEDFSEHAFNQLQETTQSMQREYGRYVTELESIVKHHIQQSEQIVDEQMKSSMKSNEQELNKYYERLTGRIEEAFKVEFAQAKQEIENYKKQRFEAVNESLADLVEQTALTILQNQLTDEQVTKLVTAALDEAAKEELFNNKTEPDAPLP